MKVTGYTRFRGALVRQLRPGFTILEILGIIAMLVLVGFIGVRFVVSRLDDSAQSTGSSVAAQNEPAKLVWQQTINGWQAVESPPACPGQPIMTLPVRIQQVTSVLYPGQERGGNYKPHGGFRFDKAASNDIEVTAPLDGYIVRGGRYLTAGEPQYTFDIMNNCGVMYRVGHLRDVPAHLQKMADTWPLPVEGDSRTQAVNPPVKVAKGDILATSIGIVASRNVFFDWGVYDYRKLNSISVSSAEFRNLHQQDQALSWHGVCWLEWLPSEDAATLKQLPPGDPTSGRQSDYCT